MHLKSGKITGTIPTTLQIMQKLVKYRFVLITIISFSALIFHSSQPLLHYSQLNYNPLSTTLHLAVEHQASNSHHLQVLRLSHFKYNLVLHHNQLTGTLPTGMGNMKKLGKLLGIHCINYLMDFHSV